MRVTMISLTALASSALSHPPLDTRASKPIVQTSSGRIHGFVDPKYPSVSQFLNIPFAQAPLGELRFAPPASLTTDAVNQDIDASKFGPVCLQYNPTAGQATLYNVYNPNYLPTPAVVNASSEDCLSLAIWAPTITKKHDALPILVWFYGGGFGKGGTNAAYFNAAPWINRTESHIVVAANYRTGFLGNPNSAGLASQGRNLNVGQLDQRLVVEWVNSNIAKFGGDPSRITIWGQSAGSISVDLYNFAYANDSLVTGLIMSSGTALYPRENKDLTHSNFTYAANHLGCSTRDPIAELSCMRKVPSSKFKAFVQDPALPGTMDFYPVIDNVTKFPISTYPQRIKDGKFSKKPGIIGSASHEGNAYIAQLGPNYPNSTLVAQSLAITDKGFLCPAIATTALRDNTTTPTYRYFWNGNFSNISPEPWQGAYHASELSMIFGTYDLPTEPANPSVVTAFERNLSVKMQDLWLAFIKNPSGGGLEAAGWPKSTDGSGGNVLKFAPQGLPDGPTLMSVVEVGSLSGVCQ